MQTFEQDRMLIRSEKEDYEEYPREGLNNESITNYLLQVRFNVLRVLPRTGKAVKQFNKF